MLGEYRKQVFKLWTWEKTNLKDLQKYWFSTGQFSEEGRNLTMVFLEFLGDGDDDVNLMTIMS